MANAVKQSRHEIPSILLHLNSIEVVALLRALWGVEAQAGDKVAKEAINEAIQNIPEYAGFARNQ